MGNKNKNKNCARVRWPRGQSVSPTNTYKLNVESPQQVRGHSMSPTYANNKTVDFPQQVRGHSMSPTYAINKTVDFPQQVYRGGVVPCYVCNQPLLPGTVVCPTCAVHYLEGLIVGITADVKMKRKMKSVSNYVNVVYGNEVQKTWF